MARRPIHPVLLGLVATYTLAGGYVHLQQWLDGYSRIPTAVPGWWVVRVGFLVSAVSSVLVASALLAALRFGALRVPAVVSAAMFAVSSLGVLIATRTGSVFGWSEPIWTPGANQARAAELGVLVVGLLALASTAMRRERRQVAVA
jgi:hypothetical protein